ncbi:hypothetical protein Pcinc_015037 [Petrolisthes cinctipes]|uniref:Uncharacterized protein n=1 Tax=Petrolisthes cinctipes TaxID=88211 RepID=A0AAE1KQ46_PETCI|nr:hypothetical protein Pcinc_015037 [Petrolisthes cinctipes]
MVKAFTLFPVKQLEDDSDEDDDDFTGNLPPDGTANFECLPPNRSPCFAHTLQLVASIETRLKKFESMEEFQLAATSDPRYKLDWCHDNEVSTTPRPTPAENEVTLYLNQPCLQNDCDPLGYW